MVHVYFSNGNTNHYQSTVNTLFLDTDFTDVTLVSEDNKHVSTHRAILSASSKFLRSLLYTSLQESMITYNVEAGFDIIRALVEYMYLGHCTVEEDKKEQLYLLAKLWGIELVLNKTDTGVNLDKGIPDITENSSEDKSEIALKQSNKQKICKTFNENELDVFDPKKPKIETPDTRPLDQANINRPNSNKNQNSKGSKETEDIAETVVDMAGDAVVLAEVVSGDLTEEELSAEMIVIKMEETEIVMKEPIVQCPVCAETTTYEHLARHMGEKHREESPICESSTSQAVPGVQCDVEDCNFLTTRTRDMKRHREGKGCPRIEGRTLTCPFCGQGPKSRQAMAAHMERWRCPSRYKCASCDSAFRTGDKLRKHKATHETLQVNAEINS